jgi:glycerophosphoryl diester phosphodiesterase
MVTTLARSVWHDFLRARRALFIYEVLFKLAEAWLLLPATALFLAAILSQAGHVAVSNQDIFAFLVTPLGMLYAAVFGCVAAALRFVEQAGIMVIVTPQVTGERPALLPTLRTFWQQLSRIVQLGAIQAGFVALALAPFVLASVLTLGSLLSEHDFYYYWNERPPVFWVAASIAGVLLASASGIGVWLCIRWAFALPILLFENQQARAALAVSGKRVRGAVLQVGSILLGWLIGVLALGVLAEVGFRLGARAVLGVAGEPWVVLILLLVASCGLVATVSFVLIVGLSLITRRLYLHRGEQLGLHLSKLCSTAEGVGKPLSRWRRLVPWLSMPLFLLAPVATWISVTGYLEDRPMIMVTAHRGHARAAPENTLSAVRKAIESGADYVEIDVHQTADGKIMVLHDRDLKRVTGLSRRLDELTYDQVRALDVGSWFSPEFAGERVPTLGEVIEVCRGKIRLNIEMKVFGPYRQLAQAVADAVRQQQLEADCIVTSLSYDAVVEAKQRNPGLRTGLIVAHALGDPSRVDVEVLSVRADFVSNDLLRSAHRLGREVHVWTVNDAGSMRRLLMRGVDNIITSDPDLAVRVRNEWASLTRPERLALASRVLLGIDP